MVISPALMAMDPLSVAPTLRESILPAFRIFQFTGCRRQGPCEADLLHRIANGYHTGVAAARRDSGSIDLGITPATMLIG